ncbi:MAG TPA: cobalamin-dependent protein, partial [bacterium]|nr:cobalamin-dependent protein [bacterium]
QGKSLPANVAERLAAVEKVVDKARELRLPLRDLVVDVLALTMSTRPDAAQQALDAIRAVKAKWPEVSTSLGVSNVSFGLPRRGDVNAAFLAQCLAAGLDAGIINPGDANLMRLLAGAELLAGRDPGARRFVRAVSATGGEEGTAGWTKAARAVIDGDTDAVTPAIEAELGRGRTALAIINEDLIPAITEVGEKYNRGEYFLPQLMLAAEAMQRGFALLKPKLGSADRASRGTVVLATVKNDIHDIGKNIVKVMIENSGFTVIDLGKDVTADAVAAAAMNDQADAVGLSALMTTTMTEMPAAAAALTAAGYRGLLMVGGAVVTRAFAAEIGAQYAADAVGAVKLLGKLAKK